jgi:PAS domain S-box-containing protein
MSKYYSTNTDLVEYLKRNQRPLIDLLNADLKKLYYISGIGRLRGSSKILEEALNVFLRFMETGDFKPLKQRIFSLLSLETIVAMPLSELQRALGSMRGTLTNVLSEQYYGDALVTMQGHLNQAFDRVEGCVGDAFVRAREARLLTQLMVPEDTLRKDYMELNEALNNYRILFDEISDGCFVNQEGCIVFANRAFCEMHGYDPKEIYGVSCQELIAEDSRKRVMERFYLHLKGIVPFDTYIYCRQDKHGNRIPTENRVTLTRYKGKPAVLGLCTDISQRIKMEEKIKQKDRLALMGRLTTSIAHEIRNPLSAVKMNLQLLLNGSALSGNDLRRLQIALEQSVRLEAIVNRMMDFAKPITLDYSLIHMDALVGEAISLLKSRISDSGVTITRYNSSDPPSLMADHDQVLEALINIISNAIDAVDGMNGQGRIDIKSRHEIKNNESFLVLTITDNGKGIAKEYVQEIFEAFFTKGKKDGVGLGLSITRKIIQAHHGSIHVKSKENCGTTFTLSIPVEISQKSGENS